MFKLLGRTQLKYLVFVLVAICPLIESSCSTGCPKGTSLIGPSKNCLGSGTNQIGCCLYDNNPDKGVCESNNNHSCKVMDECAVDKGNLNVDGCDSVVSGPSLCHADVCCLELMCGSEKKQVMYSIQDYPIITFNKKSSKLTAQKGNWQ